MLVAIEYDEKITAHLHVRIGRSSLKIYSQVKIWHSQRKTLTTPSLCDSGQT